MIPERSTVSKSAVSVFFEDVNDLDIYIEDTAIGYAKLFSLIFSRVFFGRYRIEKVFPIGDRNTVIREHSKHVPRGRPSLYIVDGDLYFLAGEELASKAGLYKLPMYCIENILCDDKAILEVLDEEEPVAGIECLTEAYAYQNWVEANLTQLFDLFLEYAISFLADPDVRTVSFPVSNFVLSNAGDVCPIKIGNRIRELRDSSKAMLGEEVYNSTRLEILKKFEASKVNMKHAISGKDYLLPLLKMRAKSIVKTRIPDINLKQRIAKRCDIDSLKNAVDFVVS